VPYASFVMIIDALRDNFTLWVPKPNPADEQGKRDSVKELAWPRPEAPGEIACSRGMARSTATKHMGIVCPFGSSAGAFVMLVPLGIVSRLQVDGCFARKARLSLEGCTGGTFGMA
jgi:hypothetical protein